MTVPRPRPQPPVSSAAPSTDGVLVGVLRGLLDWLEYGEFETDVDKMTIAAWCNALAMAIKALEARDV